MNDWFDMETVYVLYHNRTKKDHMINSIDAEKSLDKSQ